MLTLDLDQASERRLAVMARGVGLTIEQYAALVLQQAATMDFVPTRHPVVSTTGRKIEEWERELDILIEDLDHSTLVIPDEALRRESLYEDRL